MNLIASKNLAWTLAAVVAIVAIAAYAMSRETERMNNPNPFRLTDMLEDINKPEFARRFAKRPLEIDYPYWGWKGTRNEGLRCMNRDNTGCNTRWKGGKLVRNTKWDRK